MKSGVSPHILIARLSAMGDVAILPHAVRDLRTANPGVRITVLTREQFRPFFRGIDEVEFLFAEPDGKHKGLRGLYRLSREITAHGVTHFADTHNVLRTKILRTFLRGRGIRTSVIDKGRADKRALTRSKHKVLKQLLPTSERYRRTIESLGFNLANPEQECSAVRAVSDRLRLQYGEKTTPWFGLAPFAKHQGKIYPPQSSAQVARMLAEQGKVFIFGGGSKEREFAEELAAENENVISVIGQLTLDQELDLISWLDVMVSMDSATMHLASLVGVPVVSIWGSTHPYAGFLGFGQDEQNAIQLDLPCRPCSVYGNRPCLYGDYRCLAGIKPKDIVAKVLKVIKK